MDEVDGELMRRYAAGETAAFDALYARHRAPLYRFLLKLARNPELASDLFQETWGRVIATRDRYEPRAPFRPFLYRIARNGFIDHCRRAALRPSVASDDVAEDAWITADDDAPDRLAERAEVRARYLRALSALPAEQRDAFLLYEESGLNLEEIANITGVTMETAKSRLRYAVVKLKASLAADYRDEMASANIEGACP